MGTTAVGENKHFFDQKKLDEELYEICVEQIAKLDSIITLILRENQKFLQEKKEIAALLEERSERANRKVAEDAAQFQADQKLSQERIQKEILDALLKNLIALKESYIRIIEQLFKYIGELDQQIVVLNNAYVRSAGHVSVVADQIINTFQGDEFKRFGVNSTDIKNIIQDSMQILCAQLKNPMLEKEGGMQLRDEAIQPKDFMKQATHLISERIKSYAQKSNIDAVKENASHIADVITQNFTEKLQPAIAPTLTQLQNSFEVIKTTVETRDAHKQEASDLKHDLENLSQAGKAVEASKAPTADKIESTGKIIQHGESIVLEASTSLTVRKSRLSRLAGKYGSASDQPKLDDSSPVQSLPLRPTNG